MLMLWSQIYLDTQVAPNLMHMNFSFIFSITFQMMQGLFTLHSHANSGHCMYKLLVVNKSLQQSISL